MILSTEAIRVRNKLQALGLETPMVKKDSNPQEQIERIQGLMQQIMETLALDLEDDSLCDTPLRIAKMYVNEVFSGLDYRHFPKVTLIDNKMQSSDIIQINKIETTSTCEHHFITIDGFTHVAYIPDDKIIGLSKINRIVNFFAQRPQVQERLNQQILVALQTLLNTNDVAVKINATHYCVKARGVKDSSSQTQTLSLGGVFKKDPQIRQEFINNCNI